MSGLAGLWNRDGQPVEKTLLVRLGERLAHRGPDAAGLWRDGPVGLACRLFRLTPESARETQPLAHPSGPVLVFDGRLDNREELLALLDKSPEISSDSPDPALVLAAYEKFGEDFAGRLNGDFALAVFDPRRRRLVLARDALGVRPLYYTTAGQTFLFASEIKALLAHPGVAPRPDDDLLAEFLLSSPAQDNQGRTFSPGSRASRPGTWWWSRPRISKSAAAGTSTPPGASGSSRFPSTPRPSALTSRRRCGGGCAAPRRSRSR